MKIFVVMEMFCTLTKSISISWPWYYTAVLQGVATWDGEGNGTPLQYSCLEKSHGRRSLVGCSPWGPYSRTRLSDFTFTFRFHALEKEMATHSSVLAWRIPGTGEPGGLSSMGLHSVGHDWSDLAAAALLPSENILLFNKMHLQVFARRTRPTAQFFPLNIILSLKYYWQLPAS